MRAAKLEPKLWTVLREGYTRALFAKDLVAGILVAIVALPMCIAFAIASGVKPEQGLYTGVIAGFLISALGGSRVQIGGPTGAFIVIVLGIVTKHGYDGLAVATLMAGALLVTLGLCRLGAVIKFIPFPVTVGFTSGIAVVIAVTQVRDFFGLTMDKVPGEFVEKLTAYVHAAPTFKAWSLVIGAGSLLVIQFWPKVTHRVPGSLIAIILAALAVHFFKLPVETIASRYGEVPNALPTPHLPSFDWSKIRELVGPAFAIAMLGGIESLLSCVVADGMTGRRHRSNMELIGQGVANIASPFFLGIPATGAIARTATNIRNGGQTPFAGIIHAIVLLLIMLVFGKWAALIPMPALAAILLKVCFHMGEWHLFGKLATRSSAGDILVLLSTFGLTVFVDLVAAIEVGVVMAAFLFMHRMAESTKVAGFSGREEDGGEEPGTSAPRADIPAGVEVFEIDGPFFFGAADRFKDAMRSVEKPPRVLILRMHNVPTMDATGLQALEDVFKKSRKDGTALVFSGVRANPRKVMNRGGFIQHVGRENFRYRFDDALARAREIIAHPPPSRGTLHGHR